jgi:hypothetical protein
MKLSARAGRVAAAQKMTRLMTKRRALLRPGLRSTRFKSFLGLVMIKPPRNQM